MWQTLCIFSLLIYAVFIYCLMKIGSNISRQEEQQHEQSKRDR